MRLLIPLLIWTPLLALPAFACHECIVYEISSGMGRAVSVKGEPVPGVRGKLRKAIKRSGERTHVLSCLYSFDKGRVAESTKTDSQGRFGFRDLPPGGYWLAIRGKSSQVVRVVEVVQDSGTSAKEPAEFQTSDTGFTGDQCDLLQAKGFM